MRATSPNWRSASTRTTGWIVRLARATARLMATTDFPVPPLVQKTETTRPGVRAARCGGCRACVLGPRAITRAEAREMASSSSASSADTATTSSTPARERLLQDLGGQFVDDHDGAAPGPEGHEPGDLGDDVVGGVRWARRPRRRDVTGRWSR